MVEWMKLAQDCARWDELVYAGDEEQAAAGVVGQRRASRHTQPIEAWCDPRRDECRRAYLDPWSRVHEIPGAREFLDIQGYAARLMRTEQGSQVGSDGGDQGRVADRTGHTT